MWLRLGLFLLALLFVGLAWVIYRFWGFFNMDNEERQKREGDQIKELKSKSGQLPDNALCVNYCESCRYKRPSEDNGGVRCDPINQIWKKLNWDTQFNRTYDNHNLGTAQEFEIPGTQATFSETPFLNQLKTNCSLDKDCLGFTWKFQPEYIDGDKRNGFKTLKWQGQLKSQIPAPDSSDWKTLPDYGITFPQGFWEWNYR